MSSLFWVLWGIDLLLAFAVILAGIYRENIGTFNNENFSMAIGMMLILLGCILLRFVVHWPTTSTLLAALPCLILLLVYFLDL